MDHDCHPGETVDPGLEQAQQDGHHQRRQQREQQIAIANRIHNVLARDGRYDSGRSFRQLPSSHLNKNFFQSGFG